ncbi:MAG: hypothetical protein IJM63_10660 [Solobacterium sp.]|nr:hypothetical protein [Solobacterium sp.]
MTVNENGGTFAEVTLPEMFTDENTSQELIDGHAGVTYTSGTVNENGSITFRMTKDQHKAMLEDITDSCEDAIEELADEESGYSKITHNADYTEFNVRLSRKYSEYEDSYTAMVFCMYGRMCSVFTGEKKEILVSFLTEDGQTADTYSSSEFEE